jgi:Na+/phosphate symporter
MNKNKIIELKKIVMHEIGQVLEKSTKQEIDFSIQMAIAEVLGDLTATLDDQLDDIIQSEPEETCEYTEWLENMVKLLAACYQETHDMLLEKAKSKESNLYFNMPTVQGTPLVFAVNDISKLKAIGTVPCSEKLNEFIKRLEKAGE